MKTDFQKILSDFLAIREWDDEINFNEEQNTYHIAMSVGIDGNSFQLFIDGEPKIDILAIYFYLPLNVKDERLGELALLLNWINARLLSGNFHVLDGRIRWAQKIDCEGAELTGHTVSVNVEHGFRFNASYFEAIAAVSVGGSSAAKVIADLE